MSVTGVSPVPREVLLPQLDKLVNSNVLKGSESLCKLLRYLAERSVDQPGTLLKEFQIATEVFARQADFDPRLDATVRVQTGRLRSKLVEYYASEGAGDSVIFSIPKRSYSLAVHIRVAPETAPVVPRPVPAIARLTSYAHRFDCEWDRGISPRRLPGNCLTPRLSAPQSLLHRSSCKRE